MNQSDKNSFVKIMRVLQEVYVPGKPISKGKIQLYFDLLKNLTIEQLGLAIESLLKTKKFPTFPLVSEILEVAGIGMDDKADLRAAEAWSELIRLCNTMSFNEPEIKDPVLKEAIRTAFGSVKEFGKNDKKMEAADRRHFLNIYKFIYRESWSPTQLETSLMKEIMTNRAKMLEGR